MAKKLSACERAARRIEKKLPELLREYIHKRRKYGPGIFVVREEAKRSNG